MSSLSSQKRSTILEKVAEGLQKHSADSPFGPATPKVHKTKDGGAIREDAVAPPSQKAAPTKAKSPPKIEAPTVTTNGKTGPAGKPAALYKQRS